MAESIKKSDIIENDILKSVIVEFEQAQIKIKAFNDELRQTARLSKDGLNNVKFNSVTDINQAKIAILEANNAIKQKVLLEKGEIEVSIALEQAKVKQAKAETAERLRTEQENEELAVNEKFNAQIKLAKKHGKDTTALEIEQANQLNEIRLKYQAQEYAKAEELRQKELDAIKESNRLKLEAEQELQAQIEAIDEANFQAGLQKSMTEDEYALELVRQKYFALEEAAKGNAEQLAIIEAAKALIVLWIYCNCLFLLPLPETLKLIYNQRQLTQLPQQPLTQ